MPEHSNTAPSYSLDAALDRFRISLQAGGASSPKTVTTYCEGVAGFARFAETQGVARVADVATEHIEAWIVELRETGRSDATVYNRLTGLQAFTRWAISRKQLVDDPMHGIRRPRPQWKPKTLTDGQMKALLAACAGPGFTAIRDTAILRLFIDCGLRRDELVNLHARLDDNGEVQGDIDLRNRIITIRRGKGGAPRTVPFGAKTAAALDVYLDLRAAHAHQDRPELWLGTTNGAGPLGANGVLQMVRRRGVQAGIRGLHPHVLRHRWAGEMMKDGHPEQMVMTLAGWRTRDMIDRYAASNRSERAIDQYRAKGAPGDRL